MPFLIFVVSYCPIEAVSTRGGWVFFRPVINWSRDCESCTDISSTGTDKSIIIFWCAGYLQIDPIFDLNRI